MDFIIDYVLSFLHDMGTTLRIPAAFVAIEFVGTLAFAISGIRLASAKNFDWFGAYIVGMATAIGGGTIRDIMLGLSPFWMTNTIYFWCCALAMVSVAAMRRYLVRRRETLLFIFDTIGLALFNLIGIEKTLNMGFPVWCAIIMGCITGAGGGVIRDVFINEVPLIFRKEIYAVACILGGVVYVWCEYLELNTEVSAAASCIFVIVIRCLAEKYHWQLPVLKAED